MLAAVVTMRKAARRTEQEVWGVVAGHIQAWHERGAEVSNGVGE